MKIIIIKILIVEIYTAYAASFDLLQKGKHKISPRRASVA